MPVITVMGNKKQEDEHNIGKATMAINISEQTILNTNIFESTSS